MGYTGMCRSTGYTFSPSDSGTGYKSHSLSVEEEYFYFSLTLEQGSFFPHDHDQASEPGRDTGQASSSYVSHFRSVMS